MHDRMPWREGASGARLTHRAALARLSAARVVLLGEQHDRAADHRWQATVIAGLAACTEPVSVGFEMFPRSAQPALDAWVAGRSDREVFLRETRWQAVWGIDAALYMPLFELCRDLGLRMLGLNVPRPVVSLVGREGWDALPAEEHRWLDPARPARAAYRRYLFEVTGGARPDRTARSWDDPAFDRFVRAQQVWDRAFACAIHAALEPSGPVVGIIGRGHLEYGYGTPDQLDALGVERVEVALPDRGGPATDAEGAAIAGLIFSHAGIE